MLYTWTDQVCNPVVLWRNLCYAMLHFYNRNRSYEKLHNNWLVGYCQINRTLNIHDLNIKADFIQLQTLLSLERKEIIRIYLFHPIKIKVTTTLLLLLLHWMSRNERCRFNRRSINVPVGVLLAEDLGQKLNILISVSRYWMPLAVWNNFNNNPCLGVYAIIVTFMFYQRELSND